MDWTRHPTPNLGRRYRPGSAGPGKNSAGGLALRPSGDSSCLQSPSLPSRHYAPLAPPAVAEQANHAASDRNHRGRFGDGTRLSGYVRENEDFITVVPVRRGIGREILERDEDAVGYDTVRQERRGVYVVMAYTAVVGAV